MATVYHKRARVASIFQIGILEIQNVTIRSVFVNLVTINYKITKMCNYVQQISLYKLANKFIYVAT